MQKITYEIGTHKGKSVIWLHFPYCKHTIAEVKKLIGVRYSGSKKAWYVPNNETYREKFHLSYKPLPKTATFSTPKANNKALIRLQEELNLRGYSTNTKKAYTSEFIQFLKHIKNHDVNTFPEYKLRSYLSYCSHTLKMNTRSVHARMNALKFYYTHVTDRPDMLLNVPRPKRRNNLPNVLSLEEVGKILSSTPNLKHKMILATAYGMGLRISEVVNLKIKDIDLYRNQIKVVDSKGRKDRYVSLSKVVKDQLPRYKTQYKPDEYLFEGLYKGKYSASSIQKIFKRAVASSGINKDVTFHSLRHSYATHLLEFGTDLRFIKDLLGHANIKTTMVYTHVTNRALGQIESPLDKLYSH